ncbi:AraC family transcriptional regulator [Arenibacter sp. TNZ]|jgi:AraC-like DNA-binding protein|uniref:helix-turn-helix domain-containing protein n=1 Tax=Arenibacter TaxID=178469 RepID=UPI000CD40159|nr:MULTISPECIES: AraC family transcriptional regulator [Arenibacter]MCM4173397.1 AraC family transcriptional regulator [Arenibacter sp. TNZ]
MRVYLKFDFNAICKTVLREQLDILGLDYTIHGVGEVEFNRPPTRNEEEKMANILGNYGIEIMDDQQVALVQRIKDTVTEWIHHEEIPKRYNFSTYLSEKLDYTYTYLSSIFSETTYSSIENFVILKKIDFAKNLISQNNSTLTEIAFKLNYSSVAHLSAQFKKTTGLTPSTFLKIIQKRKERALTQE